MKEFEYLRNVSIGQYMEKNSIFHRLHPGFKLAATIVFTASVLAAPTPAAVILLGVLLILIISLSRISVWFVFRGVLPALPFLIMIAALQLLFSSAGAEDRLIWRTPWEGWFSVVITDGKCISIAVFILRFFVLMGTFTWFSSVTTVNQLARGTELMFSPLKPLKFPAHEASLLIAVTFRFIPILASEAENLSKAQAARGANIGTHKGGPIKRTLSFFPLFLPLFQGALTRAEELIEAMEAKCYSGGEGRTSLIVYKTRGRDAVVLLTVLAACAAVLALGYSGIPGIPHNIFF